MIPRLRFLQKLQSYKNGLFHDQLPNTGHEIMIHECKCMKFIVRLPAISTARTQIKILLGKDPISTYILYRCFAISMCAYMSCVKAQN